TVERDDVQVERLSALARQQADSRRDIEFFAKAFEVITQEHGELGPVFRAQPVAQLLGGRVRVDQLMMPEHQNRDGQRVHDRVEPDPRTAHGHLEILARFWVLGSAFWVLGSGSWFTVLGSRFEPHFRNAEPRPEPRTPNPEPRTRTQNPEPEPGTKNPEPRTQDATRISIR